MTNLKLQKILFFAQVFYYCVKKLDLFVDDVEAWSYGPIIRSVYLKFRYYNYMDIAAPDSEPDDISTDDKKLISEFNKMLEDYSASELVKVTHHKGTPWEKNYQEYHKNINPRDDIHKYAEEIFLNEN